MKVYDVNTNELPKGIWVQYSEDLQTVRFGFEDKSDDGLYAGVILTMDKQSANNFAYSLLEAASHI